MSRTDSTRNQNALLYPVGGNLVATPATATFGIKPISRLATWMNALSSSSSMSLIVLFPDDHFIKASKIPLM
ncbi:hypothetical protein [Sphingobacterium gobiense]|nr:hypothetical protein [Sphingobacterium gobiense]